MRTLVIAAAILATIITGCNGAVIERIQQENDSPPTPTPAARYQHNEREAQQPWQPEQEARSVTINEQRLSMDDIQWLETSYGLYIDAGDYWYDPVSGAWGYWGVPTAGFLMPNLGLGHAPIGASGGGTGVVVNGRELPPLDLSGLEQLLGYIYPGYYWLDANGYFGYEGGPALGNLIFIAQNAGSGSGGGYHNSTYFGNIGSDGQSSYFYDSSTGCSVMSEGGVSC